jgi:hypothetical protein
MVVVASLLVLAAVGSCADTNRSSPPSTSLTSPAASPSRDAPASVPGSPSVAVAADPVQLEVVESGFTTIVDDQGGAASYGAILRNPNADWAAVRMEVHVDAFDAGGAFIAGEEVVVTALPGQVTAIGGLSQGAGTAATVEIVPPEDLTAFQPRPATDETFAVEDVRTASGGGQTTTTGRLVSTFATEQTFVQLVAIYRDAAGRIIGGAGGGVQSIPAGGSADFEIVEATPGAEVAATEVYWQVTR